MLPVPGTTLNCKPLLYGLLNCKPPLNGVNAWFELSLQNILFIVTNELVRFLQQGNTYIMSLHFRLAP